MQNNEWLNGFKDSPTYAKSVVSKLFEKAEILQDFSELGRKVPELNDTTIREIFIYSYRLIICYFSRYNNLHVKMVEST